MATKKKNIYEWVVGFALFVMILAATPPIRAIFFTDPRMPSNQIKTKYNLNCLGFYIKSFQEVHQKRFPTSWDELWKWTLDNQEGKCDIYELKSYNPNDTFETAKFDWILMPPVSKYLVVVPRPYPKGRMVLKPDFTVEVISNEKFLKAEK